jgi:hypothetical protein
MGPSISDHLDGAKPDDEEQFRRPAKWVDIYSTPVNLNPANRSIVSTFTSRGTFSKTRLQANGGKTLYLRGFPEKVDIVPLVSQHFPMMDEFYE